VHGLCALKQAKCEENVSHKSQGLHNGLKAMKLESCKNPAHASVKGPAINGFHSSIRRSFNNAVKAPGQIEKKNPTIKSSTKNISAFYNVSA